MPHPFTRFHLQGWQMNGIVGGGQQIDNSAFVNIHISRDLREGEDPSAGSWWSIDVNHLILANIQFPDQVLRWQPHAQNDMLKGIITLMSDSTLYQKLSKSGYNSVQKFSWKNIGLEYIQIYEKLLKCDSPVII